jgi:hypothetical protein
LGESGNIVGSPCNPEEFCSDVGSADPTVRDHCDDIWTDFDCSDEGMEDDPRCLNGDRHPCYPYKTAPECLALNPSPPPPCDLNTPPGQLCRDEGDTDTCDPGFADLGYGCEPVVNEPVEEPIESPGIVPPEVPPDDGQGDQGGEDTDGGNGDDSQPDPEPEPEEDNEGDDTDTG